MKEGQELPKTWPRNLNEGTFEERQEKRLRWNRRVLRDFDPEQPDKWPGFPSGFWERKEDSDAIYPALCYSGIGQDWETDEWTVRMQVPDPSWEHGKHRMFPLSYILENYGPQNCKPGVQGIDPDWKH